MRRFRVEWADYAAQDLCEIISYIASRSPRNAEKVLEKIEERARSLETSPERGRVIPELREYRIRTVRELIVKPYRLIYGTGGDRVSVLAVFDGRRDLQDVLMDRFLR